MRDFFQQQDQALAKSAKLIVWLIVAASGTVLITGLVLTYLFVLLLVVLQLDPFEFQLQLTEILLLICLLTAVLMGTSSWHKMRQLRAGGKVIAEDLGGRLVQPEGGDRYERRVLNVVEEIAVASGIPVPAVYVLPHQSGINAFAAGLTFQDAVIGVTQGCIERLNRDQLQGVIAHEFSHILNGDMRLNLRLVGLLHGLLGIALFAQAMLKSAEELTCSSNPDRDAFSEFGVGLLMILAGFMLWPVGLVGVLFGLMVMSATSRQREFLADAYAVEFTRNPDGLASALKVLAGYRAGSRVRSSKSLEASHLFFAPSCAWMAGIFATHPPLDERIRRLDPQWDGRPLFEDVDELDDVPAMDSGVLSLVEGGTPPAMRAAGVAAATALAPTGHHHAGQADDTGDEPALAAADSAELLRQQVRDSLPPGWHELARDADGCRAVIVAVWLSAMHDRQPALARLEDPGKSLVERLLVELTALDDAQHVVLFDLALENLPDLTAGAYSRFQQQIQALVDCRTDADLVSWAVGWQLRRRVGLVPDSAHRPQHGELAEIQPACELMLSALCHIGSEQEAMAEYAFQRGAVSLGLTDPDFWTRDELSCERLDAALELVAELAPRPRRQLMIGLGRCLAADQGISSGEVHFVRGLCAALGLPVPNMLPGQPLAPGV